MSKQQFTAKLIKVPDMDAAYVHVPFDVEKTYGKKGHVKVKTTIDGVAYRGSIARMKKDEPHLLIITQAVRKQIKKSPGDTVKIIMDVDTEKRIITPPQDLQLLLNNNKQAQQLFEQLAYTNKKEYVAWIESAKKLETRNNRLTMTIEKLLDGRKNPTQK